ncbi:hypothetical protein Taro_006297 [Colocasia esculenta]|uniref:Uncharacterized protein n=1 Tax=Colocasia esculenta TaxID=4460 RepID=A0A843TQQ3_COLES|nr:hypothetical protein [Colocasia esculenta]
MSRDVTSRRSSRPRHRKVLYFPHRRLWIMEYSCNVWCKPCRCRLIPRQHSRHSWRLRPDWRQYHDVDVVSASTLWTPTLIPGSSDVDANFSDLHALQSPELRGQASPAIGEKSPTAIRPSHHLSGVPQTPLL